MPRDCSRLASHSEISPHINAVWDKQLDWATIRDSLVEGAAKAAKYGLPWDEPAHIKHLTSIREHNRHMVEPTHMVRSAHAHWGP